jgi:ribose transport system ATP-binding protein
MAVKNGICYLTEDRKQDGLFLEMSITKNLIAIIVKRISKHHLVSEKLPRKLAMEYKEKLNIKFTDPDQTIGSLSGGNQQKVLIAKLLACKPKVIIMDEPTRGIDIGAKSEIHNMLRKLSDSGVGVIVISSELSEVVGLCDRVMVMHEGKMVGELSNDEVTQENIISSFSVPHI